MKLEWCSAVSGMWYTKYRAAGSIQGLRITILGRVLTVYWPGKTFSLYFKRK